MRRLDLFATEHDDEIPFGSDSPHPWFAPHIYCSYLYRQIDEVSTKMNRLSNLGVNSVGDRVSALILDANSKMQIPGAVVRYNHRCEKANIAFVDGSANTHNQPNEEFTLRAVDAIRITDRLDEILQTADKLRQ